MKPELREYQIDLVNRVSKSWKTGHKAPCIVLPCGGGKSVIVAEIAKRTTQNGKRVLFLVHRKELCDQIRNTFTWWGVDMPKCDIMMVQTASRRIEKLQRPTLIITDENHHSKANSYTKIYGKFNDVARVGVTATPVRLDGTGLADVNDDLIIGLKTRDLINMGYLSDYTYYSIPVADLSGVRKRAGEYLATDVADAMSKRKVYGDVLKCYRELANGVQAICYCATVKHSKETAQMFTAAGIKAEHIDGDTPKKERDEIVERFRKGETTILCNVDLISEGFDVPDCGCVIMLRPTESLTLFIQQSMRCMRFKYGKRAIIIDHVANYRRHGLPDSERNWTLEGIKKKTDDKYRQCPECFQVFEKLNSFGEPYTECPYCGAELVHDVSRTRKGIIKEDGAELTEITQKDLIYVFAKQLDECNSIADLQNYARAHKYKPGWVYYQAKSRGWIREKRA